MIRHQLFTVAFLLVIYALDLLAAAITGREQQAVLARHVGGIAAGAGVVLVVSVAYYAVRFTRRKRCT